VTVTSRHPARTLRPASLLASLALLAGLASCVTTNTDTGEVVPRGDQKFPYEKVDKLAERLKLGMSTYDCHVLLGSPAEKDADTGVWVYLPERYAILVPAMALRLEFRDGKLVDFGRRPIVLGARL